MNIGEAITAIKEGKRVARAEWNGRDAWIAYSPGTESLPASKFWSEANARFAAEQPDGCAGVHPCITMKTTSGKILMGWLASQTDLLANDWEIVE